jgi:hypothetical protein
MSHVAIMGPTESGKTTLARYLCAQMKRQGVGTLVCDPLFHEWDADWITPSIEKFLAKAKTSRRCALFIEESGQTVDRGKDYEWLFTTARHWGHKTFISGHAGRQILPIMREQCSTLFLFRCSATVCKGWESEYGPEIYAATSLEKYQFAKYTRNGNPEIQKLKL